MPLVPFDGELDDVSSMGNLVPFDGELDKPNETLSFGQTLKKSALDAVNTIDMGFSIPAGALATAVAGQDEGDRIFREMEARIAQNEKAGNPDNLESTMGNELGSIALSFPGQVAAMPFQAARKGRDLIQRNEPVDRAMLATMTEGAVNAAGVAPMPGVGSFLGRVALGAGTNVALGAGADAATQALATQQSTKDAYDPYDLKRRLMEAVSGGVLQGVMGERPTKPQATPRNVLEALDQLAETKKAPETAVPEATNYKPNDGLNGQRNLFDPEVEGRGISPYEAVPGDWRIDENGMPIKADLSMDVQNMQQPLQRNLWGDELDTPNFGRDPTAGLPMDRNIEGYPSMTEPTVARTDPEAAIPLTRAIDSMDWAHKRGALKKTKLGREMEASGELSAAKMQAEIAAASGDNLRGFNAKMRKQGGGLLIGENKVDIRKVDDGFEAYIGDKKVGHLRSNLTPEQRAQLGETANVDIVKVDDAVRGKGVGKALYDAWSKANEGNVAPSGKTSKPAWSLWKRNYPEKVDAFVAQERQRIADGAPLDQVLSNITDPEIAQRVTAPVETSKTLGNTPIAKKQQGGVLFDWKKKPEVDQLKKIAGIKERLKAFVPTEMDAEGTIEVARKGKDVSQNMVQKAVNIFTKGGLYQAEKTGNPIIKFTVDKVLNADRLARADVRDYIHDTMAPAMRDLSNSEMIDIHKVLNHADMKQVEVTPEFLRSQGFSEKQVAFADAHREVMDYAFDSINRARAAAEKGPIDRRIAYSAMSAAGDFRKLVYKLDADGNKEIVGIVGAKTRAGLNSLADKFQKQGYTLGEERYMGGGRDHGGSAVQALQQALEHLAENSPATREFLDTMDSIKTQEAYSYMNAKKHTMQKKGIFGMEGRKPWESDLQNARDFMDSQLLYAESAIKWGHLADAATEVNKVLSSDVAQPNAKKWAESYFQNSLGLNPTETGRAFENAMDTVWKSTGIGKTIPAKATMYSKKVVNTLLLGLNPAFLMTNIVQPLTAMPAMNTFLKGRGMDANSLMTLGYDSMAKAGFTMMKEKFGKLSPLEQGAADYASKNHVFGTDLVDTSTVARRNAEFYLDKTGNFLASNVESTTRQMVYYGFVHMLDANGMGKEFGLAQNLTDLAMNNYSPVERPQVFNTLGPIGDLAANLSSFKHNELSRLAMFAREISANNTAKPLLMQLATTAAAAGLLGSMGFAEADWLYKQITAAMGKPDSLSRVVIDFSEKMGKHTADNKYAVSHGVFSFLGIDMSKRLGVADVIPNSLGEAMFPGGSKLVDVAGAGLSALGDPSEMNLKRFAREAAPGIAQGPMDRAWFSQETPQGELAVNRRTLDGQVLRTDADKRAKNFGFTGINESVTKQKIYDLSQQDMAYAQLRASVLKKVANKLFVSGQVDPKLIQKYMDYEGDPNVLQKDIESLVVDQKIDVVTAAKLKAMMAKSVPQIRSAQRLSEAFPSK
jgi:hypothetical protein